MDRDIRYIAKSIELPPSNERFDYFSNFHENKLCASTFIETVGQDPFLF